MTSLSHIPHSICQKIMSAFMDRVWRELSTMEEVDLTQDEHEDYDILRMLAPNGVIPYAKDSVSSLVSKELYKLGLDSRL